LSLNNAIHFIAPTRLKETTTVSIGLIHLHLRNILLSDQLTLLIIKQTLRLGQLTRRVHTLFV